jgi:hypothetical protein
MAMAMAAGICAQAPPPDVLRGTLLEWDNAAAGQLTVRDRANRVHCFRFDGDTRFERGQVQIPLSVLKQGDTIDVLPARQVVRGQPYARTITVIAPRLEPPSPRVRLYRQRYALPADDLFPRGHLTFSGLVAQLSPDRLVLRTRGHDEARILLRKDTRFLRDGSPVAASDLAVNTHVFVRAGKTYEGDIEAFQIVWGRIVKPAQ